MPPESLIDDIVRFEQYEKFAEAFASALLLPADSIVNEFKRRIKANAISYTDLVDIAREFGVSTEALLYRLQRLNHINKKVVAATLEDADFRSIDKASMSGHWWNPPPMPERYVRLAFKAYQKGKVTRARLAEYLDTSLFDLGRVLQEYGFDENENYETQMRTA
jgi:Zn-dependent peptidase ImmA (M78 family)